MEINCNLLVLFRYIIEYLHDRLEKGTIKICIAEPGEIMTQKGITLTIYHGLNPYYCSSIKTYQAHFCNPSFCSKSSSCLNFSLFFNHKRI